MKRYLDQLKPQERRWVVGIGFVVFLMMNYFFVWPHFHDWSRSTLLMDRANETNKTYNAELRHKDEYQRKLNELQSDGSSVLPEDQAIDFVHFYSSRAISNKVMVVNQGPLVTSTNEFFLVQQMGITVQSDETNLVNFLYSLAAGNSMMRVRAMSLHPDPSHQQLGASLTLVASYQKKVPVRGAGTAAPGKVVAAATIKPAMVAPAPPPAAPAAPRPTGPGPLVGPNPGLKPVSKPADHFSTNKIAGAFSRPIATNKPVPFNQNRP